MGRLSIIIPKASTIRLRNPSDTIGFPLEVTELLTWYTFPIYSKPFFKTYTNLLLILEKTYSIGSTHLTRIKSLTCQIYRPTPLSFNTQYPAKTKVELIG